MAKFCVPGTTVGLLTITSKMPCDSFSLPAHRACPGAYYGEAGRANVDKTTICGSCYAQKGMYAWPAVLNAQETRFQWVLSLQRADDTAGFVETMVPAIRASVKRQKSDRPVFRVHDSGDLFSLWYTRAWQAVCEALPGVAFWFPTRSWRVKQPLLQEALRDLAALPNVTVRPSALFLNAPAPRIIGLSAGTTASDAAFTCPAPLQDGKCLECRTCWDPSVEVSYRLH
jgi:hypothetical protein